MITEKELTTALLADKDMLQILTIIDKLGLPDCWLCAGSVRNFIWNLLSNRPPFDEDTDVDVIFFDERVSPEDTLRLENSLKQQYPAYRWELKNQAYMHHHSPHTPPYRSSRDAMAKFPETCTAIGIRLSATDGLEWFCPYGLDSITSFQVKATPHFRANVDRRLLYRERLAKKNWDKRCPQLKLLPCDETKAPVE